MPLHYHLLADDAVALLGQVMRMLHEERQAVLQVWYDQYLLHFGSDATFSPPEFFRVYGEELDGIAQAMMGQDIQLLAQTEHRIGKRLYERSVPWSEIIASMHFFEESAALFYPTLIEALESGPRIPMLFDRLSHVRIILLSEAYFGTYSAEHETREEELELELSRVALAERTVFHGMVGSSRVMQVLYGRIQAAAAADSPVLVSGESGTGKELVARAIHECSSRRRSPFIAVNCAALPTDLIESELFGHRRGAFSGATTDAVGLIRAAHGGTLLLDEITEMPTSTQAKLLRVLQDSRVRSVGSTSETPVSVRYVASTNRDVSAAVESGVLREDLYYRLNVHHLKLPPLRERHEDIDQLVRHFLEILQKQYGRKLEGVSTGAMRVLRQAHWAGNIRELRNVLEVAYAYGRSAQILERDLPRELSRQSGDAGQPLDARVPLAPIPTFEESERTLLRRALQATTGNKQKAARLLGISRKQLYAKLKKFEIEPPAA